MYVWDLLSRPTRSEKTSLLVHGQLCAALSLTFDVSPSQWGQWRWWLWAGAQCGGNPRGRGLPVHEKRERSSSNAEPQVGHLFSWPVMGGSPHYFHSSPWSFSFSFFFPECLHGCSQLSFCFWAWGVGWGGAFPLWSSALKCTVIRTERLWHLPPRRRLEGKLPLSIFQISVQ